MQGTLDVIIERGEVWGGGRGGRRGWKVGLGANTRNLKTWALSLVP